MINHVLLLAQADSTASQPYIVTAFGAAILGLVGALKVFWTYFREKADQTELRLTTKLDKCEKDHSEARQQFAELTGQVRELRGRMEERNEVADSLTALHKSVLSIVHSAYEDKTNDPTGARVGVNRSHVADDRSRDIGLPDVDEGGTQRHKGT